MPSSATIAFFGASGGCAGYCLASALKAGHMCTALARSSAKLRASLMQKGVSDELISTQLRIVEGDIRNENAVADTLEINGSVVDIITSGIGSLPALQFSILQPVTLQDPSICADAAETVINALRRLQTVKKPLMIAVSTTGIEPAAKPRDIPLAYTGLYKWLLHIPHVDKVNMGKIFNAAATEPESSRPLHGFVAIKPTLLMDGPGLGQEKVRSGTEDAPAVGYTIRRQDVGEWMYTNLIAKEPPQSWLGKGICLTN